MNTTTIQFKRTRKLLLLLPIFIVPLIILIYWNLSRKANTAQQSRSEGLNTALPGARFDKHQKPGDKMSFYQQAVQDSVKTRTSTNVLLPGTNAIDPNVTRINEELAEINRQVAAPAVPVTTPVALPDPQVAKLEAMMKTMNASQAPDPQMQQLSTMLGQIQAIQNPQSAPKEKPLVPVDTPFKAIAAIIDGNQKVLQGGEVRLKLTDSVRIKGMLLQKGQLLFGSCNITNQRLMLDIKNIRLGHAIIPINLTVFSLDGLQGIPAPEAELAGAAGGGANNALESMQFLSMDESLATQAAAGGIEAAKGLIGKKVTRVKVRLKNGFPLLLRNNDSQRKL